MRAKYIVASYWRGSYVETMCDQITKKEAERLKEYLEQKASPFIRHEVLKIGTTRKIITNIE